MKILDIQLRSSFAFRESNDVLVSPWTGWQWARIDKGYRNWMTWLRSAEGEEIYFEGDIPGSIIIDLEQIEILPYQLLVREFNLIASGKSFIYNGCELKLETAMTQDLKDLIAQTRVKVERGEVTQEELREVLKAMRQGRTVAAAASAKAKKTKVAVETDPEKALEDFLGGKM